MRNILRKWFGLRCMIMFCPGDVVTIAPGKTFWRCVNCGAQTKPQ